MDYFDFFQSQDEPNGSEQGPTKAPEAELSRR
jgi:hypothetical protein